MRGVLLIALGHSAYGAMARTLAASIKANNPDLPVCLASDGNVPVDTTLFDQAVIVPPKYYTRAGRTEYLKAKLHMYELSPFDETLFLDVDQILVPGADLNTVFDAVPPECPVSFSNTGIAGASIWVDLDEVKARYPGKEMWNYHSELVVFRKCPEAKAFFKAAQKIYGAGTFRSAFAFAGGAMADELAFQIASMETGIYPHAENWLPNFWYKRHAGAGYAAPYTLKGKYLTYSIGGARLAPHAITHYNTLAAHYVKKLGLQNPYRARDKRAFLPERSKI